jgi:predicted anti-sigma-YlaC factor YlaD
MQHLTEEDLVLLHYHEADTPAASEHLRTCEPCRAQYDTLKRVLALVSEAPVPERGASYENDVWNRLRWRLDRRKRRTWQSLAAIAAVLAIAFVAGQWWEARQHHNEPLQIAKGPAGPATPVAQTHSANNDRLLILVVGDHLENSERVLTELANADPKKQLALDGQQARVQDLVVSNRLYRQSATERGDKRMASILSDLEPVLTEIANAPSTLTPEQVRALQRRIDAQGLLFKVRLISAQTSGGESAPPATGTSL